MEKSYYKRELGDGSAISVVKTWCAAAEKEVPTLRILFREAGRQRALDIYLYDLASGEPVANGVATALLRAGKTKKEKAE